MYALANTLIGIGVFLIFLGLVGLIIPIVGIPFLLAGGGLVQGGRMLRVKAREQAVRRQLGG